MTTILNSLSLLDISDKEQQVYEALLELGLTSVTEIAQATSIQRSTAYLYLESLKKKGLVSEATAAHKKYFKAIEVQNLGRLVNEKIIELKKLKRNLSKIKINKEKLKKKTDFLIYRGLPGFLSLLNETVKSKEEIYFLGNNQSLDTFLNWSKEKWNKIYHYPRRRKGIAEYLITDYTKGLVQRFFEESGTFTKVRFLPPGVEYNGVISVFGNKLVIAKYQPEPMAVVLEDKTLVELFKMAFISLWKDLEGKNMPAHPA